MSDKFMKIALEEAKEALRKKEVPVGAVIVKDGEIISSAHNMRETLKDTSAHAELLAIKKACKYVDNWRLTGCEMYVTLEPCVMCAGAILQSRIKKLYIGTFDPTAGACGSSTDVIHNNELNHFLQVKWMYDEECSRIITDFFKSRR